MYTCNAKSNAQEISAITLCDASDFYKTDWVSKPKGLNRDDIMEMVRQGIHPKDIAKHFNVSHQAIRHHIKQHFISKGEIKINKPLKANVKTPIITQENINIKAKLLKAHEDYIAMLKGML